MQSIFIETEYQTLKDRSSKGERKFNIGSTNHSGLSWTIGYALEEIKEDSKSSQK